MTIRLQSERLRVAGQGGLLHADPMPVLQRAARWRRRPTTSTQSFTKAAMYVVAAAVFVTVWLLVPESTSARVGAAAVSAVLLLGRAIWDVANGLDLRRVGH